MFSCLISVTLTIENSKELFYIPHLIAYLLDQQEDIKIKFIAYFDSTSFNTVKCAPR